MVTHLDYPSVDFKAYFISALPRFFCFSVHSKGGSQGSENENFFNDFLLINPKVSQNNDGCYETSGHISRHRQCSLAGGASAKWFLRGAEIAKLCFV